MSDTCATCGNPHITRHGTPACAGHVDKPDQPLRPCAKAPIAGATVCRFHGGAAPQVRAAATQRLAQQAAAAAVSTLGLRVDVSPTDALLEEVQWTAGHVAWLRQRVQELEQSGLVWGTTRTETEVGGALRIGIEDGEVADVGSAPSNKVIQAAGPSTWYELYERERKHLVTVCTAALKAGVEERRVRLAEQQGDLVAEVIRRILDALNLTAEQQQLVPTVVPQQLRLIAGGMP